MALDLVQIELESKPGEVFGTIDRKQAATVSGYFARLFASKDGDKYEISDQDHWAFFLFCLAT